MTGEEGASSNRSVKCPADRHWPLSGGSTEAYTLLTRHEGNKARQIAEAGRDHLPH